MWGSLETEDRRRELEVYNPYLVCRLFCSAKLSGNSVKLCEIALVNCITEVLRVITELLGEVKKVVHLFALTLTFILTLNLVRFLSVKIPSIALVQPLL